MEELLKIKQDWYNEASNTGKFEKLAAIARALGVKIRPNWGPKWEFIDGDTRIYLDDYGNYVTVMVGGRLVCSTHNQSIYIPDVCDEIVAKGYPVAEEVLAKRKAEKEQKDAEKLRRELGFTRVDSIIEIDQMEKFNKLHDLLSQIGNEPLAEEILQLFQSK